MSNFKNIQVIDGADNSAYDIYQATNDEFRMIFSIDGQDIQFAEDLSYNQEMDSVFNNIWNRVIDKKNAQGIHGTLFYGLSFKKKYYPNKKETDIMSAGGRRRDAGF